MGEIGTNGTVVVDHSMPVEDNLMSMRLRYGIVTALVPPSEFRSLCGSRHADVRLAAAGVVATHDGVRVVRQQDGPYVAFGHDGDIYVVDWGER